MGCCPGATEKHRFSTMRFCIFPMKICPDLFQVFPLSKYPYPTILCIHSELIICLSPCKRTKTRDCYGLQTSNLVATMLISSVQRRVHTSLFKKLFMGSGFDKPPIIHNQDSVALLNRFQTVCNNHYDCIVPQRMNCF